MAYITPLYPGGISDSFLPSFEQAAAFWSNVIEGGLPPKTFPLGFNTIGTQCGVDYDFPSGSTLQGLGILISVIQIDGAGNIIGTAGPCSYENGYPRFGVMRYDLIDASSLANYGLFYDVVVHEMGHVLGIGTTWAKLGLVSNACSDFLSSCSSTPSYVGEKGLEGYKLLGGTGELLVADERPDSWNLHWNEGFFQNELMTTYVNTNVNNAISVMTILSLMDLGYKVNMDAQEAYEIPAQARIIDENETVVDLKGDVLVFEESDFLESLALFEQQVESNEKNTVHEQFTAIIALLMIGFVAMFFFISYEGRKQRQALALMMRSNQESNKFLERNEKHLASPEAYIEP